ncbi:MAG: hypothetical protein EXR29_11165 [Betaproteobacteria bacterium]|nr:hypothetical protein [Betaproteobacteria bacterium]
MRNTTGNGIDRSLTAGLALLSENFQKVKAGWLLASAGHGLSVASRRATLIVVRARVAAALFAASTILWIPLDFTAFPNDVASLLAIGRALACVAFVWLALAFRASNTMRDAFGALFALYAVACVFYFFSPSLIYRTDAAGIAGAMVAV